MDTSYVRVQHSLESRDYDFNVNSSYNSVTYVKCGDDVHSCQARGKIVDHMLTWTLPHNHRGCYQVRGKIIKDFKKKLYNAVTSSLRRFRLIYDDLAYIYPKAAVLVPFQSMESTMLNWRRKFRPLIPGTLSKYAKILNMPQWNKLVAYEGGSLSVKWLCAADLSTVVVICDSQFLQQWNEVTDIYIDI